MLGERGEADSCGDTAGFVQEAVVEFDASGEKAV